MGLLKSITKAVSGIFKSVKKVFKSITKSSLGKVLLVAAAVYLGGAYLGAWGGPSWMPTMAGGAGAAGAEAAGAAAGASGAAGTSGAAELLAAGEAGVTAGGTAATGAAGTTTATDALATGLSQGAEAASAAGTSPAAANLAGAQPLSAESVVNQPWNAPGASTVKPPVAPAQAAPWYNGPMGYGAVMAGGGLIQGIGAGQAAEEKIKAEREAEERRQALIAANFDPSKLAALGIGMSPSGAPLTDINGNPVYPAPTAARGIIGPSMAPRV